jgi:hypothetical protein
MLFMSKMLEASNRIFNERLRELCAEAGVSGASDEPNRKAPSSDKEEGASNSKRKGFTDIHTD